VFGSTHSVLLSRGTLNAVYSSPVATVKIRFTVRVFGSTHSVLLSRGTLNAVYSSPAATVKIRFIIASGSVV